jgi:L-lactate dehydrogenase complex protein LldE
VRVAVFITCVNDTLFPRTGTAMVEVLERLGATVEFPEQQTCCGQMHFNSGYARQAIALVRGFVRAFADSETVVAPSASCVAMVRDSYPRVAELAGDAGLARAVLEIAPRVLELSEAICDRFGVEDVGAYFPHRVVYHPTCHGARMLHLGERPLRLLRAVRGLDLAVLEDAEVCCGFGGTFALKNAEVSSAMLADKVACVLRSRAEVCTAADSSCLMQIGGALSRQRAGVRTMHLAEILACTEADEAR